MCTVFGPRCAARITAPVPQLRQRPFASRHMRSFTIDRVPPQCAGNSTKRHLLRDFYVTKGDATLGGIRRRHSASVLSGRLRDPSVRLYGRSTLGERLSAIRAAMNERKLVVLVALHDGAHFVETPDPVMVLTAQIDRPDRRDGLARDCRSPGVTERFRTKWA
jgi:hypothetical protein